MMNPALPSVPSKVGLTHLQETVAAPTIAHAQTLVSVSVREAPQMTMGVRTTVLPRIEVKGTQAELVFDGKTRFEKIRVLGEGGLGEVVGAHDHDIGRKVAIKRLKAEVRSPAALARFVDEIRTIGKLDHPNIIPIHDVGMDETGDLYFVMKYVEGETLESIIEKLAAGDPQYHRHYTFERRVEIFRSLLEALAFAHDKGIIHRDLKPANIMIGKFGEVMLMDWGIAKSLCGDTPELPVVSVGAPATPGSTARAFETQLGALVGTPLYMAPEQASGLPTDERSDVYSACMVLCELLYLRHPFQDKRSLDEVLHAARTEAIRLDLRDIPHQPPVPAELMWFLKHGLEKDPSRRYPSVRAMLELLDRRAEGDIRVECPVTAMKQVSIKSTKFIDRHPVVFIGLTTSFLLLFIAMTVMAVGAMAG
ncbi:MAG: serine/threonine protein kinase [Polyangiaceae bacterium]|nr:serine/threonine protein kinase [Polyangiaceae bacterium]